MVGQTLAGSSLGVSRPYAAIEIERAVQPLEIEIWSDAPASVGRDLSLKARPALGERPAEVLNRDRESSFSFLKDKKQLAALRSSNLKIVQVDQALSADALMPVCFFSTLARIKLAMLQPQTRPLNSLVRPRDRPEGGSIWFVYRICASALKNAR